MRRLFIVCAVFLLSCAGTTPAGECIEAGAQWGGKTIPHRTCCEGLTQSGFEAPVGEGVTQDPELPEGCGYAGGVDAGWCIDCGDGVCGAAENVCNCPEDCVG